LAEEYIYVGELDTSFTLEMMGGFGVYADPQEAVGAFFILGF
jgi:hypothetical protein